MWLESRFQGVDASQHEGLQLWTPKHYAIIRIHREVGKRTPHPNDGNRHLAPSSIPSSLCLGWDSQTYWTWILYRSRDQSHTKTLMYSPRSGLFFIWPYYPLNSDIFMTMTANCCIMTITMITTLSASQIFLAVPGPARPPRQSCFQNTSIRVHPELQQESSAHPQHGLYYPR